MRPHRVDLGAQVGDLPVDLVAAGDAGRVVLLGQCGLLHFQAHQPAAGLVQFGRLGVDLGAEHGAGLVDEVDGLVRQVAVRDVAVGQLDRRDEGAVLDAYAVEHLEPFPQPAQDRHGVLR